MPTTTRSCARPHPRQRGLLYRPSEPNGCATSWAWSIRRGRYDGLATSRRGSCEFTLALDPTEAKRAASAAWRRSRRCTRPILRRGGRAARGYLAGSWGVRFQTVAQRAERLVELERVGFPPDEPIRWPDRIARVSALRYGKPRAGISSPTPSCAWNTARSVRSTEPSQGSDYGLEDSGLTPLELMGEPSSPVPSERDPSTRSDLTPMWWN